MEFSLITNDSMVAAVAQSAGVERIFIDLERLGKDVRQKGRQLFLSTHEPSDIARLHRGLSRSKLIRERWPRSISPLIPEPTM